MTSMTAKGGREALEAAVARFFHMCNSHCPGNVAPLMTADVEFLADEKAVGQDAVNTYFVRLWEAYPCLSFFVENVIVGENGHGVAVEVTYKAGPGGDGARCFVFQFRGELIKRIRCY